jgi:murein DD-endopeptidase MepM/ murein hydrolase activator NlpD
MSGFLRGVLYGLVLIAAGWVLGSIYPAPEQLTAPVKQRTDVWVERIDFSPEGLETLRASLSPEQFSQLSVDAARFASNSGDAILVEHDGGMLEEHMDNLAMDLPAAPSQAAAGATAAFDNALELCPSMTVSNAPPADANRMVRNYASVVNVNGVALAVAPTRGACLSSSFGARNGRTHKGIDLHSRDGGPILAAADGTVVEKKYRDDYGNMLLIDHGNGVYTRYAHLSSFAAGVQVGAAVTAGQQIGLMGNTASYRIPVHLHYELLLGDYNNPRGSFGLAAHSPFEYPRAG